MRKALSILIFGLVLTATSALAQVSTPSQNEEIATAGTKPAGTADWETPAQETICDGQIGAAFGICNAYCEALDCHLDNPNASATACDKLLNKFLQITGVVPPCEVTCPCSELPFFSAVLDGSSPAQECFIIDLFGVDTEVDVLTNTGTAAAITGDPTPRCGEFPQSQVPTIIEITFEQSQTCNQALIDAATNQGVVCQNVSI